MKELEAIKERADKASLGPWGAVRGSEYDGVDTLAGELTWDDHNGEVFKPADADFVAHARTDIPKLIAALEAVEERLAWLDAIQDHDGASRNANAGGCSSVIRQAITEALQ